MKKKIIITQGDPNGIGSEIILRSINCYSDYLVVGNSKTLSFYASLLSINCNFNIINRIEEISLSKTKINVFEIPYDFEVEPGKLSKQAGAFALECIDKAFSIINNTEINTLITLPVNKEAIILNYKTFMGHTEYLGKLSNIKNVTMLMASKDIKVALVSTHIALKEVPIYITKERILSTIKHGWDFLNGMYGQNLKVNREIAVCSLNPHGGEGGHFGKEEKDIIIPAIKEAKRLGIKVRGPIPGDTIFCTKYPLYIALYHDQGLIPFKLLSFNKGVNITLGLPFFRVSVDHGTAFDIAGQNKANIESFKEAIKIAKSFI